MRHSYVGRVSATAVLLTIIYSCNYFSTALASFLSPCEVCGAQVALSNSQQLMVHCHTKVSYRLCSCGLLHCGQLEICVTSLFCVVKHFELLFHDLTSHLTDSHLLHIFPLRNHSQWDRGESALVMWLGYCGHMTVTSWDPSPFGQISCWGPMGYNLCCKVQSDKIDYICSDFVQNMKHCKGQITLHQTPMSSSCSWIIDLFYCECLAHFFSFLSSPSSQLPPSLCPSQKWWRWWSPRWRRWAGTRCSLGVHLIWSDLSAAGCGGRREGQHMLLYLMLLVWQKQKGRGRERARRIIVTFNKCLVKYNIQHTTCIHACVTYHSYIETGGRSWPYHDSEVTI